jgi:hypothetical protein
MREDGALVIRANDGVGFPVTDAAFLGDDGRALTMSTRFGMRPRPEVLPLRWLYFLPPWRRWA